MDKYDVGKCINCGLNIPNKELNANGGLCNNCKDELLEEMDSE